MEDIQTDFNVQGTLDQTDQKILNCRICGSETFCAIDLGNHPFANALEDELNASTKVYPLKLHVCRGCSVGQLSYCADAEELYKNYLYMSPDSSMMLKHFAHVLSFLEENNYINKVSNVLEIGSNIGNFLEFLKNSTNSVVGVDPAVNISKMANDRGIPTVNDFFNSQSAESILKQDGKKDLIIARHCFAHNEKPWMMLEGVQKLLANDGVLLIENAYFLDTVTNLEFDQIYHEHMYFYNVRGISKVLDNYGFKLVDAYHSPIHGGTVLYMAKFKENEHPVHKRVYEFLEGEKNMHLESFYVDFVSRIEQNKNEMLKLIGELRSQNKTIHAYGASAKSTTLLNYYQLDHNVIPCTVDSTKIKQGKYIPKVNIKVISEEEGAQDPPDYYLLTSWNYKDEIIKKVRSMGNDKTKFILPHPKVEILNR